MEYNFIEIEQQWQQYWSEHKTFKAENVSDKPKFYVLDMFPYPSGAGLHVGHPLGYIASDIYARYKRLNGFNVLHPMGYDAYGLPAEQYAIQTGQHPAITTEQNLKRYREQLDKIGFSFDWDREVRTCEPNYYKWTQWTFIQLFEHWYNKKNQKAEPISELIDLFKQRGNHNVDASTSQIELFSATEWNAMSEKEQQLMLMHYRLTYLSDTMVNWCPQLGTVLANDEVINGLSARGGYPVERKLMRQWSLRITAYADRLLNGLDALDWSDSIKEIQRNWIGRSEGASINFNIEGTSETMEVFTTRPDTIFGVTFMVFCPEHELLKTITTPQQKEEIEKYIAWAKNRTERERQTEVKKVSGVFTGAYAINPFNGVKIPIWVSEYVLAGYGTGAIMAVPAHDSRDFGFARHFNLPIVQVINKEGDIPTDPSTWEESYDSKEGICINSDFITGMTAKVGSKAVIEKVKTLNIGKGTINFRLRDAIFSRQRYWGEPFPVYYKDEMPYMLSVDQLPLELPAVDKYLPTESGEPPLARAKNWKTADGFQLETNTMPGFAGSSAYYLRYMDPTNNEEFFSKKANNYWENVDLYIGGAEHATGHLLYARFWNKFLFDLGLCCKDEPFKKLINQGMIQGVSALARIITIDGEISHNNTKRTTYIFPPDLKSYSPFEITAHIPVETLEWEKGLYKLTNSNFSDLKSKYQWMKDFEIVNKKNIHDIWSKCFPNKPIDDSILDSIKDDFVYIRSEVEKMSKTYYNVQNPDDLVEKYGADTLRMYEMFLGPLEQSKPWDTKGIEGVFRFLKKFWRLFHDVDFNFSVSSEAATIEELKILHKAIKKIKDDTERFSFNTAISVFMICVNELQDKKCNKREILEPLTILISSYAPHIAEELWKLLGNSQSITFATFPKLNESYLAEDSFNYPVSFNGKMRFLLSLSTTLSVKEIETAVLENPESAKWLEGKTPKKVIIVPKKIVNIVI